MPDSSASAARLEAASAEPVSAAVQQRCHADARSPAPRAIVAIAVLAIAASFAVMCVNLGTKPFWVDESIAVLPARSILATGVPRSPFDLNYMSHQVVDGLWDPSAPLYRYSVAAFTAFAGFSETTTRGWSVLLGLGLLVPCFLMFRRLYGDVSAWIAIALLASLPSFAEHCREARHFTFVACAMYGTYYFLLRAGAGDSMRARAWWPVLLLATVLGHYVGYIAVPIVLVYLLAGRYRDVLAWQYSWVYAALAAAYAALQAKFWNTLPFFHSVGCHNRHPGCEPDPFYYVWTIVEFLGSGSPQSQSLSGRDPVDALPSLLPVLALLVIGIAITVRDAWRGTERAEHLLVLASFLIPLVLLSTQELKFPRYLFYIMPTMCLFVARGAVAVFGSAVFGRAGRVALAAGLVLLVLGPGLVKANDGSATAFTLESRFVRHARMIIADTATDTWERTRAQVTYLSQRLKPGDIVVTSFDDAGLGYYLGQFVHGFLNNAHDDEYFLRLLASARENGVHVHFIDMLPEQDYCHTPGLEPFSIKCREKYAGFAAACMPQSRTYDPTCVRKHFR